MNDQIPAPWTPEQVEALNWYQTKSGWHPFTCGSATYCGPGWPAPYTTLVATESGWTCPRCDYTQDWAYDFMFRYKSVLENLPQTTEAFDS